MASGNVRFSESRMEARKSAIHRLAHATQSSLNGNAAVAHIRGVAQATQDPLRLLVGRDGAAEAAVNAQPAMLWTAADALERVERDAEERKQKKLEEERKRAERARTTEENKRKRAEHQAGVEQRKQARAAKKAARDAEKEAKRLAREAAGLPARGARRKKATTPGVSGDEASDGSEDAELEASMSPPASATTTTQQSLHCRGAVCRRARQRWGAARPIPGRPGRRRGAVHGAIATVGSATQPRTASAQQALPVKPVRPLWPVRPGGCYECAVTFCADQSAQGCARHLMQQLLR